MLDEENNNDIFNDASEDINLPYKIDSLLGYVKPFWIPDEQADICMYCDQKFTLVKRRHHCRACGKILCSNCCNKRLTLPSMDNKLCRVCIACFQLLENDPNFFNIIKYSSNTIDALSNAPCHKTDNILVTPDPSKPEQYCSKLPPLLQVSTNNELPVIYVPIYKQGILKNNNITSHNNVINHVNLTRESLSNNNNSNHKLSEMDVAQPSNIENNQFLNESYDQQTRPALFNKSINSIDGAVNKKQVMFSDGVRPGGDLSLLDDNAIKPSPSKSKLAASSRKNLIKGKKEKCLSSFVMPTVNHIPPLILKFSDGKLFAVNSSEITISPETFNGNSKLIDSARDNNYKLVICANLYLEICIEEILKEEEYVTKSNNNLIAIICKTCGMQNVGLHEIFFCFSVPPPYNDSFLNDDNIKTSSKNNLIIPHKTNLLLDNYELFIKDFGYQIYQIYLNAIKGKGVSHLDFHAFKNFAKFKDKFWFEEPKKDCSNPTTTTFDKKGGGSEQQNLAANLSIDSIYSGFLLVRPTKYSISHLLKLLTSHRTPILKTIYDSNNPSYLAVLVHKWETPWAKLLPLRLLLRLGLQAQNYPYPVTSPVDRVSTFYEINHTIINLLADCRNFKYTLPRIPGLYISYRNKCLTVTVAKKELRRNLRSNISSELSSISDHVLALAANFNPLARSHLVCVQNENDSHYTKQIFKAILPIPKNDSGVGQIPTTNESDEDNLGGTFIVFNGSLKACPPLSYTDGDYQLECQKSSKYIRKNSKIKISTVEDGFIVHVSPHDLNLIATALKESQDLVLGASSTVLTTNKSSKNVSHYQTQEPQRTLEINNTLQLINDIDGNNLTNGLPSAPSATLIPAPLTPNRWSLEGEYYFDNENAYTRGCDNNLTVPSNIISLTGADGIFSSSSAAGSVTAEADNSFKLINDDVLQVQQPPLLSSSSGNCFNLNALAQSLEDLSTSTTTTSPSMPVPSYQPRNQNNNDDNNNNTDHMFSNTKSTFAHANTDINLVHEPEEELIIKWIDGHYDELESKYSRVKSLIDGLELQDAFNFKPLGYFIDYIKRHLYVRLVDIYYIKTDAILLAKHDTLDADQFAQDLSKAFCSCVVNRLELLTACNVKQINLRITLDSNKVGYELSPLGIHYQPYITEIDEYLIPIIHSALNYTADLGSLVIELVFHILKI